MRSAALRASCLLILAVLEGRGRLAAGEEAPGWVGRQGAGFVCEGRPFPVVGLNCYYFLTRAASPSLRPEVIEVLDEARALGATVIRTWAFNDGADEWNSLQLSPGVYSESAFVGLDHAIHEAGKRGLRLLLPLVNNWDAYGGMNPPPPYPACGIETGEAELACAYCEN